MEELFDENDEETTFTWQDLEQNLNILNEAVAQLVISNNDAIAAIEEIQKEVAAQREIISEIHAESKKLNNNAIAGLEPDSQHDESLEKLKNAVQGLIKLQSQGSKVAVTSPAFANNSRTAMVILVVGVIIAALTSTAIHFFPPPASAKNEQQWYAIFQRVDRLYQEKFGSKK